VHQRQLQGGEVAVEDDVEEGGIGRRSLFGCQRRQQQRDMLALPVPARCLVEHPIGPLAVLRPKNNHGLGGVNLGIDTVGEALATGDSLVVPDRISGDGQLGVQGADDLGILVRVAQNT
jgi:hypothetical protein